MEDQRNNIDNFFREGLGSYTETPPPAVWDALEKKLDGPRKRVLYLWFLFAFVSTSAVLGYLASQRYSTAIATGTENNIIAPAAATQPANTATYSNGTKGNTATRNATHTATSAAVASGIVAPPSSDNDKTTATQATRSTANSNNSGTKEVKAAHNTTASLAYGKQTVNKYTGNRKATTDVNTTPSDPAAVKTADATTKKVTEVASATNHMAAPDGKTLNNNVNTTTNNTNNVGITPVAVNDTKPAPAKTDVTAAKTISTSNKKNKTVGASATPGPADNDRTEIVASKQNNIKVVSEVPASVLAAEKEKKANEQTVAKTVAPAKTVNTAASAQPQKMTSGNVRFLEAKPMFTETVTTIVLPATGTGNNAGAPGDAAAKDKKPSRLEFGIKAGYETGTRGVMASKYDVAPYLKYNISKRSSIIVQPGIKFAAIKNTNIDPSKYYYKLDTSFVAQHTSVLGNQVTYSYNYFERGDSFKVSHSIAQRSYLEIEIPVMYSYQASKKLSILAGIAMTYSKLVSISKDSTSYTTFNNNSDPGYVSYTLPAGSAPPTPPGINTVIQHTALPYLTLANPAYNVQTGNVFSLGYLLGFSYMLTPRWMIDGLVQQNIAGLGNIKNSDIKSLYTQPYVRLMIGFKITKPREQ